MKYWLPLVTSSGEGRRRQWHPIPALLPGKSHGGRSLVGCSPGGRKESDTTERFHFHFHALEKERATHSSVLAWRIAGKAEPGGLPSVGSHRVGHDWSDLAAAAAVVFSPPVGFSGQKYCSGLPCPPPGDFPDSGIESSSLKSPALAGRFYTTSTSGKPLLKSIECKFIENNEYEKFL